VPSQKGCAFRIDAGTKERKQSWIEGFLLSLKAIFPLRKITAASTKAYNDGRNKSMFERNSEPNGAD
jgi:hypothetical protein